MKTSPSSIKIRQIVTQLREGKLVPRPEFQRRLVWTSTDKIRFIETILKGYPFPEIYLANGPVDVETGEGQQLLVDGQQRVTTIALYFGGDPSTSGNIIPAYIDLEKPDKEKFLNYDVAVRDLGSIGADEIIEVFKRINSTKYSLNEIEINNAVYEGELMRLASAFAEHNFFDEHRVFRSTDIKRMGDVRFMLQTIITMIVGYFNRDDAFERNLQEFNDNFPMRDDIAKRLLSTFSYIDECGFRNKSRFWKRSDLFTALVEIDNAMNSMSLPDPAITLERLDNFYETVDANGMESGSAAVAIYAKAAIQASNDRINRIRRGVIFQAVLQGADPNQAITDHLLT